MQGPDVHLNLVANTWFESDYIVEARCTEEHMVHGKFWGAHISWVCPQFCAQAQLYHGWKVESVKVEEKKLVITFGGGGVRLICDGQNEEQDFGWCLSGKVQMMIGQLDETQEPYGSIPDEVQAMFSSGWEWTKNDD